MQELLELQFVKNGVPQKFYYRVLQPSYFEPTLRGLWVYDSPQPLKSDPYFEIKGELCEGYIQLKVMDHSNNPRYKGKGLPAASIAELSKINKIPVRSSMGVNPNDFTDRRSQEATYVWEKMAQRGTATHFPGDRPGTDYFEHPPTSVDRNKRMEEMQSAQDGSSPQSDQS